MTVGTFLSNMEMRVHIKSLIDPEIFTSCRFKLLFLALKNAGNQEARKPLYILRIHERFSAFNTASNVSRQKTNR